MHPITQALLAWYSINARKLPWRSQPNPYYILVSELMLQQTRVETVLPYFQRFISRFPTLKSLAQASQQDVLAVWEGLGCGVCWHAWQAARKLLAVPLPTKSC